MPRRYKPVKTKRLFTKNVYFNEIKWNNWNEVISRFEQQLRWWYVSPIQFLSKHKDHAGFPVVALCCLLLDTLSQYEYGLESSDSRAFRKFVRTWMNKWCTPFKSSIRIWDERRKKELQANDFADVLWSGFRCGILHESHGPLYCRLWETADLFEYAENGYATYADTGADCPVVSLNPGVFANEACEIFHRVIKRLKNPTNVGLHANFKKKFLVSYGIDIGNEPQ